MSDYPGLRQLVTAYFHQDWFDDYQTQRAVVTAFVNEDELAGSVPDEIHQLLSALDDVALEALVMNEYRCGYAPGFAGQSVREWLAQVAVQIAEEVQTPPDA